MVWAYFRASVPRAPRVAIAVLLLGALAHCSGSKTAEDDQDRPSGEGGEGAGTGGKAGSGGGGGGSSGQSASGGTGGVSGNASGGKAGATGGSGGSSNAGETGEAGAGGVPSGCDTTMDPDCTPGAACGNGVVEDGEVCDDGGTVPLDGCDASCGREAGFVCSGSPSLCVLTTCGNRVVEAGEGCDDGNTTPLDGCSPECREEPGCDANGCTSPCGDGIIVNEACDDGNTLSGDGCSSTCTVETGYTCNAAACDRIAGRCVLRVPVVFRDFNGRTAVGGHPDFSPGFTSAGAVQGLLLPDLDAEGKPQLAAPSTLGYLSSVEGFAEWYRDVPSVNSTIPGELVLWDDGSGGYVNRWGAGGERWKAPTTYLNAMYGGPAGGGCTACTPLPGESCVDPCPILGLSYACCASVSTPEYDGNPLFFPIDSAPNALTEARSEGRVPEAYGFVGWPWESAAATDLGISTPIPTATAPFPSLIHNFNFTTEVRFFFRYEIGRNIVLDFTGDDDLWVFLNGKLAVDLGAWHVPLNGSLTLLGDTDETIVTQETLTEGGTPSETQRDAAYYGLVPGQLTSIAIFHAERQREGSSFRLGIRGLDVGRSVCVK